ncbi:MAG: NYN domain-containing protein [Gemmatimonadaceae bacterium]
MGGEAARQKIWLDAVSSIAVIEIIEGYHSGGRQSHRGRKEEETDVHIAVSVVVDAARDRFDRAILVTGDRDQGPTVRAAALEFGKRVDVWISPNQDVGFWKAAEAYNGVRVRTITPAMLRKSRLPERLQVNGREIEAPRIWRAP